MHWYYRLRSMVPRIPLPLPNPGKIADRLSRDPGSGGPRGQDWALVRVREQDRIKAERRDPRPHAQMRSDLVMSPWESIHCEGSSLLTR